MCDPHNVVHEGIGYYSVFFIGKCIERMGLEAGVYIMDAIYVYYHTGAEN